MSKSKKNRELNIDELKKVSGGGLTEIGDAGGGGRTSGGGSGFVRISARRIGADTGSGTHMSLEPLDAHQQASPEQRNEMGPMQQG